MTAKLPRARQRSSRRPGRRNAKAESGIGWGFGSRTRKRPKPRHGGGRFRTHPPSKGGGDRRPGGRDPPPPPPTPPTPPLGGVDFGRPIPSSGGVWNVGFLCFWVVQNPNFFRGLRPRTPVFLGGREGRANWGNRDFQKRNFASKQNPTSNAKNDLASAEVSTVDFVHAVM